MPIGAAAATDASAEIAERMTRRAVLGFRYDADLARRSISFLDDLQRDLLAQIAEIDVNGVTRISAKRKRLQQLLDLSRADIRKAYRGIRVLNSTDLADLATIEATATHATISTALVNVGATLGISLPTAATMAALAEEQLILGQPLADWWEDASRKTILQFSREMRIGVQAGETVEQLARRISGGTREGVQLRGIMDVSRTTARTLVRTSVASIQGAAREAVYEANLDVIEAYVQLSRLDSRTSETCIVRANKRWDAQTKAPIGHALPYRNTPLHPNCRSVMVVQVVGGEPPPVMDGEAWVKSLSEDALGTVLGKGKADLYRAGKIQLRDLIDQSDRPVPLSALVHAD